MSTKAKSLGTGRFGSSAAAPVSARRQAVAAATGVPTEGVAPPTQLPVDRISPNPDNPRSTLGDLSELAGSLKEHGQKQAITVMNRDAYLKVNPGKAAELEPDTTHVVIDGSSRLAAAREAGLATIKVWVDDEQGADSEELLESALVANIHRSALPELDEARALQRLLNIHGSQAALAKRLHKSQGWISQRLALLNLTPELQEKVGQEPIKFLRAVGNRPKEEQAAALEELKRKAAEEKAEATATAPAVLGTPAGTADALEEAAGDPRGESQQEEGDGRENHYPVIASGQTPGAEATEQVALAGEDAARSHYPVMAPAADEQPAPTVAAASTGAGAGAGAGAVVGQEPSDGIPEPRTVPSGAGEDGQEQEHPRRLPYGEPFYVARHLRLRMEPQHRARLIRFLLHGLKEDDPTEYAEVLEEVADHTP